MDVSSTRKHDRRSFRADFGLVAQPSGWHRASLPISRSAVAPAMRQSAPAWRSWIGLPRSLSNAGERRGGAGVDSPGGGGAPRPRARAPRRARPRAEPADPPPPGEPADDLEAESHLLEYARAFVSDSLARP